MVTALSIEQLVERYPRAYHMAAAGSWQSILRHGLLSTSALLDLFEIKDDQRERIESRHRPESITIVHARHGTAVVRDQKPMSDNGLRRALQDGLTPREWYEVLNRKVFFWLTRARLETMMNAAAYRSQRKTVIELDTRVLLTRHRDRVRLAPMNTGCTKPFPHPRGASTFAPIDAYPFEQRRQRRSVELVVELAVEHSVPDVDQLVLRVDEVGGGRESVRIMSRSRSG